MIAKWNPRRRALGLLLTTPCFGLALCTAGAGSYIVAQCSPGVYTGADDAGFTASTTHYTPHVDCSPSAPGLQITHSLVEGETGTVQGGFGAWVWTAPAGTYITGGSTFSRLATEDGQHGYLAVSPDSGAGLSYENQNDDQGHESGIPAGNWRFLVAPPGVHAAKQREPLRRWISGGLRLHHGNITAVIGHFQLVASDPIKREWSVTASSDMGGAARADFVVVATCETR